MSEDLFPDGRRFAFTVFDDTDNSVLSNTRPVYDCLAELGFRTTKSVWVEPACGVSSGACLRDDEYREWILELQNAGFEIGSHGVGDGDFSRQQIIDGAEYFKKVLGDAPQVYTNHMSNPYNVYWWSQRFPSPFNWMHALASRILGKPGHRDAGHVEHSSRFWGDVLKRDVKYIRNFTFNDINTLACDPAMPYRRPDTPCANYWFSSSDGHTVEEFNDLLSDENVNRLEAQGGACIVYTHFASGFVGERGELNREFRDRMQRLADRDGWFVPCGELLDHLMARGERRGNGSSPWYQRRLAVRWWKDRLVKRLRYGR